MTDGPFQSRTPGRPVGPSPDRAAAGHAPERAVIPADVLARVNAMALRFFRSSLDASWVPAYLGERGFTGAVQDQWQAGHAPAGWDALTRYLRSLGVPDPLIEGAGLARRSRRGTLIDVFRDRAMLPIRSADGTIAAFIGRAAGNARPGVPKYVNSPRTSLYDKSEVLFGLWEARPLIAAGAQPVIVEGPFDAIAVTVAGRGQFAGLAPCGTALTRGQVTSLGRVADLSQTGMLVAFDADRAGRRAAVRAYHLLSQFTDATTAAVLPAGQDPAQILAHGEFDTLPRMLTGTQPLADLVVDAELEKWNRWLGQPEGRLNALRAAAPIIAAMPVNHVARQVARVADTLGIEHRAVTETVAGAIPRVLARRGGASATLARRDLTDRALHPRTQTPDAQGARRTGPSRLPTRPRRAP